MNKTDAVPVPITVLGAIGRSGPIDRDIDGRTPSGGVRGPFDILDVETGTVPTYPVLWEHAAERERAMCFDGDSQAVPRQGATPEEQDFIDAKVERVWDTAAHAHFNINFRFNSQSTGMQFTIRRTIGGRAWQSVRMASAEHEKAVVLWTNTSLGMLLRWWHSNKQQAGRGNVGKTAMTTMPVLDMTKLTPTQLANSVQIFDSLCEKQLLAIHEIDTDVARKELDERFGREVLNLRESMLQPDGALDVLRRKLAQEPSIRGNK